MNCRRFLYLVVFVMFFCFESLNAAEIIESNVNILSDDAYATLGGDIFLNSIIPCFVPDMEKIIEKQFDQKKIISKKDREGEEVYNQGNRVEAKRIALELKELENQRQEIIVELSQCVKDINLLRLMNKKTNQSIANNTILLSKYAESLLLLNEKNYNNGGMDRFYWYRWKNFFVCVAQTLLHEGTFFYLSGELDSLLDKQYIDENNAKCLAMVQRAFIESSQKFNFVTNGRKTPRILPIFKSKDLRKNGKYNYRIKPDEVLDDKTLPFIGMLKNEKSFGYKLLKELYQQSFLHAGIKFYWKLNFAKMIQVPLFNLTIPCETQKIILPEASMVISTLFDRGDSNFKCKKIITIEFDGIMIEQIENDQDRQNQQDRTNQFINNIFNNINDNGQFYLLFPYCESTTIAKKLYDFCKESSKSCIGMSYSLRPPIWL